MLVRYWVNVPIWDEWDTPGATLAAFANRSLTWCDLFAQHNESRKFVPRLIYLALFQFGRWDVRVSMVVTFLTLCIASAACLLLLRHARTLTGHALLAVWFVMNLLLFAPSQYENLLSGFMFEVFLTALCLFGMIAVNLARVPLRTKALLNAALAWVATYTFAHGMFLWAAGLPIPFAGEPKRPATRRSRAVAYAGYLLAGVLSVAAYFVGYHRPEIAPPMAGLSQFPQLLDFFAVWIGAVLQFDVPAARIAGAVVLLVALCALVTGIRLFLQKRIDWLALYPWLVLGSWALLSGFVTALGRVSLGTDLVFRTGFIGFSAVRYNGTAVFFYLALIGLLAELAAATARLHPRGRWRVPVTIAALLAGICLAAGWAWQFTAELPRLRAFHENRRRALAAVQWIDIIPNNPELFLAYPYASGFGERVDAMQRLRVTNFRMAGAPLARILAAPPPAGSAAGGFLDSAVAQGDGTLRVTGWARNPATGGRADFAVLGWQREGGAFHPWTAVRTGQARPDLARNWPSEKLGAAGFDAAVNAIALPSGRLTLTGWAVDLRRQQAFPLGQSVQLERSAPSTDGRDAVR